MGACVNQNNPVHVSLAIHDKLAFTFTMMTRATETLLKFSGVGHKSLRVRMEDGDHIESC
jgi:hypothetical protein